MYLTCTMLRSSSGRCLKLCTNYLYLGTKSMAIYAFLFPGQGSQYVGMTEKLADLPAAQEIFSKAERVLGYDLRALCLRGPQSALDETVHSQPAVVAASLAAVEWIKQSQPELVAQCGAAAGFSVGEITALVFAGALTLEKGLQLIKVRAEAMHLACLDTPGTMATVRGVEWEELDGLCQRAKAGGLGEVCVANHIFPKGYVVSGTTAAVESVKDGLQKAGIIAKDVAVSGAFHSALMSSAVPKIGSALESVSLSPPTIPVYSNVTGLSYRTTEQIRTHLAAQVTQPVLWEQTIRNIIASSPHGVTFVELGPGHQLKVMLKRIDKGAFQRCISVEV